MRLDLTLLTVETRFCPEANTLGQTRPHKLGRSMYSRVGETMKELGTVDGGEKPELEV